MKKALILFLFLVSFSRVFAKHSTDKDSSFSAARDHFLQSLENKDLSGLMEAVDDSVTMIFPDGDLMRSKISYLKFNQAWFKKNWKITAKVLVTQENGITGYSLIKYKYIRYDTNGSVKSESNIYLILIFQRKQQWLLVHNQHTKVLV